MAEREREKEGEEGEVCERGGEGGREKSPLVVTLSSPSSPASQGLDADCCYWCLPRN